ncbi:leucine-rich repeat-containing protein 10B [Callorhinchus milii]|uniref:Disease resistance R13L4/SHOC-2-like LRR domain-containing protein n=1 Tax=Callorhinchus milii TaxID=7868 RepID=A0A4W3IEJ7_CALMI|nr:leucine-rich repeat-containing protein 10B [Callorhinchus milii]
MSLPGYGQPVCSTLHPREEGLPPRMKMGNAFQKVASALPFGSEEGLSCIDTDMEEVSADRMLDVSYKKIKRFPSPICSFTYVEKLYISNNRLRELPGEFEQLVNLKILALDYNKFEDVPKVVCTLHNLTRLYLGSNRLMTIPSEFRNLENLRCLWIESNYFRKFPKQLLDMPSLKSLQMGDNRLKSLPEDLVRLLTLRGFWLYGNRFEDFPRVLLKMEFLEILDVDKNKITQFPNMEHLERLKLFCYDHNPAKRPPKVADGVTLVGDGAEELLAAKAQQILDNQENQDNQEPLHGILKNGSTALEPKRTYSSLDCSQEET